VGPRGAAGDTRGLDALADAVRRDDQVAIRGQAVRGAPAGAKIAVGSSQLGLRRRVRVLDLDHHLLAARQARAMHLADGGGRDWFGVERDGVAADQGWPLYLQRFADLVASEID
jgi:hypothetical protein